MARVFTIAEGLENMGALKTGGQGSIYKVRRTHENTITAVKLLPTPIYSESPTDKAFIDFQNEVQKLSKVNEFPNPNVVKILSSGITETGSLPYIEMEFIEGPDLEELLKPPHNPVFSIKETLKVAEQLASAIAHCHKVNVKHGDVKSNNVKFNEITGNYVLLDFGMAVMSDEQRRTSLRQAGAIEFMAPEQSEGHMLFETDVYSFGIILYELLAGTVPFPLRNKSEAARNRVMMDHLETPPPDLLTLRRQHLPETWSHDIRTHEMYPPKWLVDTVYKCIAKQPEHRFANGMELYEHIKQNNTLSGQPKEWTSEELNKLRIQNEKLQHDKEELQRVLDEFKTNRSTGGASITAPAPNMAVPEQKAYTPRASYPVRKEESSSWSVGTVLFIVILLCAVGGIYVYSLTLSKKKPTADKTVGTQPQAERPAQVIGQYKVLSQRAYFHNEADENTKRTGYVIPSNDVIKALDERNDFVYTEFTNNRGQTTKGWLRKQDLITLEDWARQDSGVDALPGAEDLANQLKRAREMVTANQIKEALYIYSYLSEQGVPEAMYHYGNLALQGKNMDITCDEGMHLVTLASNQGYTPAKRTLGFLYVFAENRDILEINDYERCTFERNLLRGTQLLIEAMAEGDTTAKRLVDEVKKWTGEGVEE